MTVPLPTPQRQSADLCPGYDNEILADATYEANQDPGSGTVIYDSIYNCYDDGFVVWSAWCGGGGLCDKQKSPSAHALCKGEPVDTGRPPPDFPEGGEDAPYNEDPSYGEPDDPYWPEDPYQSDDPYRPQGTARAIP